MRHCIRPAGHHLVVTAVSVLAVMAMNAVAAAAPPQDLEKSVVLIRSASQAFDYDTPWKQKGMSQGVGSGFVIAGDRILTNAHNVSNCKYVEVRKQNLAQRYVARVAYIAHDCDLAILSVWDTSFFAGMAPLELGGIPPVNTTVQTCGFPIGGRQLSFTEGVVSRVQMDIYSHTGADQHLVIQTDAAINPGNSGGPVLQEGKVVGVAFQGLRQAENIGYMIPTTVIRHFLKDVEDGKYDGFGSLGFSFYAGLHSASYKDYLKVPPDQDGIVVVHTQLNTASEAILQVSDVITQIDDYNVDNDGMVRIHDLRLHMAEVAETKQIGESVRLTFYRQGERMQKEVKIALNRPVFEYSREYDQPPRYVCFGGLVFVPATRNFLETWGSSWVTEIPYYLRYLFYNSGELNTDRDRREYVVLAGIMPDEINSYADDFENKPVESINGVTIHRLDDVATAFAQPTGDFHIIKFMGAKRILPMAVEQAQRRNPSILKRYDIPTAARLERQL